MKRYNLEAAWIVFGNYIKNVAHVSIVYLHEYAYIYSQISSLKLCYVIWEEIGNS